MRQDASAPRTDTPAAAPTPLRRSQADVHELTLGELKDKCQDIVASLDRAIIEHERTLQSLGAVSTTSGNKITWELPQLRSEAELPRRRTTRSEASGRDRPGRGQRGAGRSARDGPEPG